MSDGSISLNSFAGSSVQTISEGASLATGIMKKIPAYLRGVSYATSVDDEDYSFLSQFRWTAKPSNRTVYAQTNV